MAWVLLPRANRDSGQQWRRPGNESQACSYSGSLDSHRRAVFRVAEPATDDRQP